MAAQDEGGDSEIGNCYFCGKAVGAGEGKVISRTPMIKIQCKECKRVDQSIGRSFGSIQWLRELPFDKARTFYVQANGLNPKQLQAMVTSTLSWQDEFF